MARHRSLPLSSLFYGTAVLAVCLGFAPHAAHAQIVGGYDKSDFVAKAEEPSKGALRFKGEADGRGKGCDWVVWNQMIKEAEKQARDELNATKTLVAAPDTKKMIDCSKVNLKPVAFGTPFDNILNSIIGNIATGNCTSLVKKGTGQINNILSGGGQLGGLLGNAGSALKTIDGLNETATQAAQAAANAAGTTAPKTETPAPAAAATPPAEAPKPAPATQPVSGGAPAGNNIPY